MVSKMRIVAVAAIVLLGFVGYALASPPVPPPEEGYVITTSVDVVMDSGDFTETESMTWTWLHDTLDWDVGEGSTLAHGDVGQALRAGARGGQIRYTEELVSIDTGFFQFNKSFGADSHNVPNHDVDKIYGWVADTTGESLITSVSNTERVGLSIVANGDSAGLGDMPSLRDFKNNSKAEV